MDSTSLSEQQRLYAAMINQVEDGLVLIDCETLKFKEFNDRACAALGYRREEFARLTVADLDAPGASDRYVQRIREVMARQGASYQACYRHQNGALCRRQVSAKVVTLSDRVYVVERWTDIPEGKGRGDNLELREHFHRVLLSDFPFAAWLKDREGRYLEANVKLAEYYGLASPAELLGKTIHDFFPSDVADPICAELREVLNGETVHTEKQFFVNGGTGWFDIHQAPITVDGELVGTVGCAWDITKLKLIEKDLAESEERYRRVVEVSPEAIFIHCEGRFVFMNMAAAKLLGAGRPEDLYGRLALDFVSPKQRDKVAERIRNAWLHQDNPLIEEELIRLDGRIVSVEMVSVYFTFRGKDSVLAIARDIGERKRMQEELIKAQKLESLGVLAGGIAHDFNNILMAIIGNADLAMMRINKESPVIDHLRKIELSAVKAADLAKQMLAYSGKGMFVIERIDLNLLLQEMLHMLEVSISKKVLIRFNLVPDLPAVEVDATQIRQVVMNLMINASEAIGDKSGVIAITTGCMDCDKSYLKDVWLVENIVEGFYVYLEVTDTGCGMAKDTLEKIFEPFYTTKFTGRGLGMAAVLGIIRGHKGAIKIYSEPGKGSTFKILLPASEKPAAIFNYEGVVDDWKGDGTVLLVDDEETVRGIGKEMLQEFGFEVITANDGREAVEIFKNNPSIDLVLLDLTMPHMDGEQCFRELKLIRPGVKVIMSSGYNEQEVTRKFVGKGLAGFVQKPYKLSVLKAAIVAAGAGTDGQKGTSAGEKE